MKIIKWGMRLIYTPVSKDMVMTADSKISISADSDININTPGKTQVDTGSWKVIEGGDFFQLPGTGNITVEQHIETFAKLIGSLT